MRVELWLAMFGVGVLTASGQSPQTLRWSTNGPAVFATVRSPVPANLSSASQVSTNQIRFVTNTIFDHYLPESLNNLVWTNFLQHTNGKVTGLWSTRFHPRDWPTNGPVVVWNSNCLAWDMKGLTALSPCWEVEGASGQVPVTALTRRHGYTRGHGMGPDGFNTNFSGRKVWFVARDNRLITVKVLRDVVRFYGPSQRDYTILLFDRDLPGSIDSMPVTSQDLLLTRYRPNNTDTPIFLFRTEALGNVSAGVPGFAVPTWKGGDSGSPDMVPLPGKLVFEGGRSTSGPSPEMQGDMDALCVKAGLDPKRYQLEWVDLSRYPAYSSNQ